LRDPRGISAGRRQQRAEGGGAWLSLRSRRLPPARSEASQSPAESRREREQLKRHHIAINTNVVSSSIKIRFKRTVLAGIPPLVIFFSPIVHLTVSGSIAKTGSNSQVSKTLGDSKLKYILMILCVWNLTALNNGESSSFTAIRQHLETC
jgi:hypothetical protein